ncbi:hypothetical protein V2J09_012819 [Rumex salicifolius]
MSSSVVQGFSKSLAMTVLSEIGDKTDSEELAEVEKQLDDDWKTNAADPKDKSKDDDTSKKERRAFLTQFFSPILLKAFSITFFGEWGDKSQLATIGLAADENPFGVVLGGILPCFQLWADDTGFAPAGFTTTINTCRFNAAKEPVAS